MDASDEQSNSVSMDQNSANGFRIESDLEFDETESMIGPIPKSERRRRVIHYLTKKYNKAFMKKFCYKCRKQVAEKRLRIKGRFVTKDQAFEILGMTQDQLLDNEKIQSLLTQHAEGPIQLNSLI